MSSRLLDYDLKMNPNGEYWLTFEVTSGTAVAYSMDGKENIVSLSAGRGNTNNSKQLFPDSNNQVIVAFEEITSAGKGPRKPKISIDG